VKTYSKDFKLEAVRRMNTCKTISGLAAEPGVARRFLYKWREQLRRRASSSWVASKCRSRTKGARDRRYSLLSLVPREDRRQHGDTCSVKVSGRDPPRLRREGIAFCDSNASTSSSSSSKRKSEGNRFGLRRTVIAARWA